MRGKNDIPCYVRQKHVSFPSAAIAALTCGDVNNWVGMREAIREYYLILGTDLFGSCVRVSPTHYEHIFWEWEVWTQKMI